MKYYYINGGRGQGRIGASLVARGRTLNTVTLPRHDLSFLPLPSIFFSVSTVYIIVPFASVLYSDYC